MKRMSLFWSIIALMAVILGAYSAYWFWGARQLAGFAEERLSDWQADGFEVTHGMAEVTGFPGIIRVTYPSVSIADAAGQWYWWGQDVELSAQPWKPLEFRGALKGEQQVSLPLDGRMIDMVLSAYRADVMTHFDLEGGLAGVELELVDFYGEAPDLEEVVSADYLYLSVDQRDVEGDVAAQLRAQVENLVLPKALNGPLGREVGEFQTTLNVIEPLPQSDLKDSLTRWQQQGGHLLINWLTVDWGTLGLQGKGRLGLDGLYRLDGALDGQVSGLGETLEEFGVRGLIDPKVARLAAAGARLFSMDRTADGRPAVKLPILLEKGDLILGPLKLAAIPPVFEVEDEQPEAAAVTPVEPATLPPVEDFPKTEDGAVPAPAAPVIVEELGPPAASALEEPPTANHPSLNQN